MFLSAFFNLGNDISNQHPPPASYQSLQCPRHLRKLHAFRGGPVWISWKNPWKNPRFFGQVCAKVQTSKRYLDDLPVLSGFAPDQFSCLAVSNRLRERINCCISITFWPFSPQISLLLNGLSILFLHFDGFDCYLANIFWICNQVASKTSQTSKCSSILLETRIAAIIPAQMW